ncbi:nucleocapsid protein, partial [Flen virus]
MAFKQQHYTGAESARILDAEMPDECAAEFTAADTDIAKVIKGAAELQFYLQMVMAEDVFRRVGTSPLNLWALKTELGKLIPSIFEKPAANVGSKALNYMELVLFTIAPATRQVKAGVDSDKFWNIRAYQKVTSAKAKAYVSHAVNCYNTMAGDEAKISPDKLNEHPVGTMIANMQAHWNAHTTGLNDDKIYHVNGTVTLATFKSTTPPSGPPAVGDHNNIMFTIKQASLLALDILNDYTDIAETLGLIVLTPLAGAIFARTAIPQMAGNTAIKAAMPSQAQIVRAINSSAQSGGQHLHWSRADIAAVCAYVATSGMTDRKLAGTITQKTVRQYTTAGKPWSR